MIYIYVWIILQCINGVYSFREFIRTVPEETIETSDIWLFDSYTYYTAMLWDTVSPQNDSVMKE